MLTDGQKTSCLYQTSCISRSDKNWNFSKLRKVNLAYTLLNCFYIKNVQTEEI